jgi:MFS family permease
MADRVDRITLLMVGLALLVLADLSLAFLPGLADLGIGVLLWGFHMGFTQGLLATLVADAAPAELRGTAFGIFNLIAGVALLAASVLAGALWDWGGHQISFLAGAAFASLAGLSLLPLKRRLRTAL